MLEDNTDIEMEMDVAFNPLGMKVVSSKGKKKRKAGEVKRCRAVEGSDNDEDDPASPSQYHPPITSSRLEANLAAVKRFMENSPAETSTPPPFILYIYCFRFAPVWGIY